MGGAAFCGIDIAFMVIAACGATALQACRHVSCQPSGDFTMQWTTPSFTDLRFGFEITMYIANR
jgi:coenzyme PQQ precursor peptide PqqA